jgi:DNA-binding MarR family transcriptional regulator
VGTPDDRHATLVGEALAAYRRSWAVLRQSAKAAWAQLDLTLSQLKGLLLLDARGLMTIGELADVLEIGRPSASILIEQLVQRGLVERAEDPSDRRRTLIRLTASADTLVSSLYQGDEAFMCAWFDRLANADLEALTRGFIALVESFDPSLTVGLE